MHRGFQSPVAAARRQQHAALEWGDPFDERREPQRDNLGDILGASHHAEPTTGPAARVQSVEGAGAHTQWSPASDELAGTSSSPAAQNPAMEKKRKYKKRKATSTVRKEQKVELEQAIRELEATLDGIKLRALMRSGEALRTHQTRTVENVALRNCIREEHMRIARARALLSSHRHQHIYGVRPTEIPIRLGADRTERHCTLSALRESKLRDARRFILARSEGLSPKSAHFQEERYETAEGDHCAVRFDITPMRGIQGGVKAVSKALQQAAFNAEIVISETSGEITIREDDDVGDENLSQMRFVTTMSTGVHVEHNLVRFADASHAQDDGVSQDNYTIAAIDFVDEDALYPYLPHQRVRRDSTSVVLVTSYMDAGAQEDSDSNGHASTDDTGQLVVVITRWSCSRMCRSEIAMAPEVLRELRNSSVRVLDTFLNCVRESLGLITPLTAQ